MEHVRKHSRKRDAILNCVRGTDSHPTADWVFNQLKPEIPDLSLGTVYRNLAELAASGEIMKFDAGDGTERYDGYALPHYHMICKNCHSVLDIELDYDSELDKKVAAASGADVDFHSVLFSGTCKNCKNV